MGFSQISQRGVVPSFDTRDRSWKAKNCRHGRLCSFLQPLKRSQSWAWRKHDMNAPSLTPPLHPLRNPRSPHLIAAMGIPIERACSWLQAAVNHSLASKPHHLKHMFLNCKVVTDLMANAYPVWLLEKATKITERWHKLPEYPHVGGTESHTS